ncbi:MAG: SH3 domain-containing protein [Elusimicrobia bacterium]|nr:SH3 domain-containing protein [Elusimicrobiota bacterium]
MVLKTVIKVLLIMLLPLGIYAEMMSVATRKANVRKGPDGNNEILWEAWIYTPFKIIDKEGMWYKVTDFEDDAGWVHSSALSGAPSVIVNSEKAYIRKGPGSEYQAVWMLERGYPLKFIKQKGNWYHVSDGEEIDGWIHKSVVWGFVK